MGPYRAQAKDPAHWPATCIASMGIKPDARGYLDSPDKASLVKQFNSQVAGSPGI